MNLCLYEPLPICSNQTAPNRVISKILNLSSKLAVYKARLRDSCREINLIIFPVKILNHLVYAQPKPFFCLLFVVITLLLL